MKCGAKGGTAAILLAVLVGCSAPEPPEGTGGTAQQMGPCGRGFVVVSSDFQSTNVSLVGVQGAVLSSSFLSSASEDAALSAALSGDVVVSSAAAPAPEIVLIDRFPASVLTWVDVASAAVRAQLNVATGFVANPQDYLAVSEHKAYVSRYETNPAPGREPFDEGGDLLIVDPATPSVDGRIDLGAVMAGEPGFLPRAGRMQLLGERLFVLLSAYSSDFTASADSRVVTIDTAADSVIGVTVLAGMHGCTGIAAEPWRRLDGDEVTHPRLAVACSGEFGGSSTPTLSESGVVLLSTEGELPTEIARFGAEELGGQPIGFSVDFVPAHAGKLLVTALGAFGVGGADVPDALLELDIDTGMSRRVAQSPSLPFELGDVRCASLLPAGAPNAHDDPSDCGYCYLADAEQGVILRLKSGASTELDASIQVDNAIGLPPRLLGRF